MVDAVKMAYSTERATEHLRIQEAAEEAEEARNMPHTHPTLGKLVAVMPERDYFRLVHKYGLHEVQSREFLHDFQKRAPQMAVAKV